MCTMSYNGWGEECQPRGCDCPALPCPAAAARWAAGPMALLCCPARAMSRGADGWACRLSSPVLSSRYPPLLSLWDCLTWKEMENVQSPPSGGECFGGSFRESTRGMLLSGNRNTKNLQGEEGEGRESRAEGNPWLLGVAELVSAPWAESAAPRSFAHPLLSSWHSSPHPRALPCLLSLPNTSPVLPWGEGLQIQTNQNIQCLSPETPPSPWCWTTDKWVRPHEGSWG